MIQTERRASDDGVRKEARVTRDYAKPFCIITDLIRPEGKVPMAGHRTSDILPELLEDVLQRQRKGE